MRVYTLYVRGLYNPFNNSLPLEIFQLYEKADFIESYISVSAHGDFIEYCYQY